MSRQGPTAFPPELKPSTVTQLLEAQAERNPDRVALVGAAGGGSYERLTFVELSRRVQNVAAAIAERFRIGKGDRVAWMLPNDCGVIAGILYHAVARLGAVNVPINDRLATLEIQHILDHSASRLFVFTSKRGDIAEAAAADVESLVGLVVAGDAGPSAATCSFADLLNVSGENFKAAKIDPGDDLCLVYTSGTTGTPKGVLHTHGSALSAGVQWADVFRLREGDTLQSPFPIFSGAGLHFNGLSTLWSGACFVIEHFEPERTLETMADHQTTVYVAVPTVYRLILDKGRRPPGGLDKLRILDYGGASMPLSLIEELRAAFPGVGLMQTFGLTEAGPGGIYLPEDYVTSQLGSIGNRPMGRYTKFRVVTEDGRDVGPGEVGEFIITGPSLMKCYYRDPEATATAIRDGWLWTGDIVRLNEQGFVYHVDRRKDLVIRGGYNISSSEVESALAEHPAVQDAAIVAKPHPTLGEDTKAFVVLKPGAETTVEELISHCATLLADWKIPRDFEFREDLPRNAAGKVLKRVLREEAARAQRDGAA